MNPDAIRRPFRPLLARMRGGRGALAAIALALATSAAVGQEDPAASDPHAGHDHGPGEHHDVFERSGPAPRRTTPWDPEILALAERLPIQEQGRIKPLSTFAKYKLLSFNGASRLSWVDDRGTPTKDDDVPYKLSATEWLLDCLFFPEQACRYPCFQLQTSEVADAIHVPHEGKKKRDRYSYDELRPGLGELGAQFQAIKHDPVLKDGKNRTVVQEQIVQLAMKIDAFNGLIYLGDYARYPIPISDPSMSEKLFDGQTTVAFGTILDKSELLIRAAQMLTDGGEGVDEETRQAKLDALNRLAGIARQGAISASALSFFPPTASAKERPEWLNVADLFMAKFGGEDVSALMPAAGALESALAANGNMPAIRSALAKLNDETTRLAQARGEAGKVGAEVAFYKADLFFIAQWLYVLGFLAVAFGWMARPGHKIHKIVPWALLVPLALHVIGITWRCWLRARPPVTTLYETILFIGAVAVIAALVVERLDRRRIAVGFAAAIGALGLFLAASYEAKDAYDNGSDTMPQLQAVLDTNFWLSTHVTTVTIGYSAGLLAALLAHVYVLGKLFGLKKNDPGFYRAIGRMVYGVICFGLLFSVVGTILGGVWANDSWGRFWGWDPKENGALMICLWELAILHARMGGYIKDLGISIAAIFGGTIVAFSWWHVNLLGVGLHSYGFTHGLLGKLWISYGIEWLVVLAGLWLALDERARRKALATPGPTAKQLRPHPTKKSSELPGTAS